MRVRLEWLVLMVMVALGHFKSIPGHPVPDDRPMKLLGSRVVTSISVMTDHGELDQNRMAAKQRVNMPAQELPASPAGLLRPDRFQFYTYDKKGDVVMKQMTKQEIQSLIAAGGGHVTMEIHEPQSAGDAQSGGTKVADIIQNVQNVLKAELSKPAAVLTSVPTIPSHTNSEWSSILTSILSGESETVPLREPDQAQAPVTPPKSVAKPAGEVLPEEKPMIPVPIITVQEKVPNQDQVGNKPIFGNVDTTSIEKVKPDQQGALDQVSGASETVNVKPVTVEKLETRKNETVTIIAETHTTSMKIPGQEEVQVDENAKPEPVQVEKPLEKKPDPEKKVQVQEDHKPESVQVGRPVEKKPVPDPEQEVQVHEDYKPIQVDKPVEAKPKPEKEAQEHVEQKPGPILVDKPVEKKPEPDKEVQEPEKLDEITSTIAPVMLNNKLKEPNVVETKPGANVNENQILTVTEEVEVTTEAFGTPDPEEIPPEEHVDVVLIDSIESSSKNQSSEGPTTGRPDDNLSFSTIEVFSTPETSQPDSPSIPSPIRASTSPEVIEIPKIPVKTDVESTSGATSSSTSAPPQPPKAAESPAVKIEAPGDKFNGSKTEIIDPESTAVEKPEEKPILSTAATSIVEESSGFKPVDPLPTELADSLSSMMFQVSDSAPSIIPPLTDDNSTVPPTVDVVTDQINFQSDKSDEMAAKSPVEETSSQLELVETTTVLEETTEKSIELPTESTKEPLKPTEVNSEGLSTSTTDVPSVESVSAPKHELTISPEAPEKPVEEVLKSEETQSEIKEPSPSEPIKPSEVPQISSSTYIPEVQTPEESKEESKATKPSAMATEPTIIRLDIMETKPELVPTVGNVEKQTESTMVRIKLTDPGSVVHQTLESSPVQGNTPAMETVTLPPMENASANGIASGLIAGFSSTTTQSTTVKEAFSSTPSSEPSNVEETEAQEQITVIVQNVTEEVQQKTENPTDIPAVETTSATPLATKEAELLSSTPCSQEQSTAVSSTTKTTEEITTSTTTVDEIAISMTTVDETTRNKLEPFFSSTPKVSTVSAEEDKGATTASTIKKAPPLVVSINSGPEIVVPDVSVKLQPNIPPKPDQTSQTVPVDSPKVHNTSSTDKIKPERTSQPSTMPPEPVKSSPVLPENPTKPPESTPSPVEEKHHQNGSEPSQTKTKDQKKDSSMEPIPPKSLDQSEIPQKKPEDSEKWTLIPQPNTGANAVRPTDSSAGKIPTVVMDPHPDHQLISLDHVKSAPSLDSSDDNLEPDIAYFVNLCNDLAFNFWTAVNSGLSTSRSLAVSPYGMTTLLAMIFLGARGGTSYHMNNVLKFDDVASFNPHITLQNITDSLSLAEHQGIANAAFVRELFADRMKIRKLMPFYKEQAQKFYDGIVAEVKFGIIGDVVRRRTNLSIRKQTGGRIKEFLKNDPVLPRSPLAAVSANVFETDCSSQNATSEGRDGELYFAVSPAVRQRKLVPVPATLWKTGVLAGYEPSLDATAIALGDVDNIVSTIFVVPGQAGVTAVGDNLEKLEERILEGALHNGAWNKLLKVVVPRPGLELQVPKFCHTSFINATAALKTMGLQELFEKHADLKGMDGNGIGTDLHLADVLQINRFTTCGDENILSRRTHHEEVYPACPKRKARASVEDDENVKKNGDFITFMEEATSLRSSRQTDQEKPRLKLDRPFLYFVRHNPTGSILHMGRFNPRLLP